MSQEDSKDNNSSSSAVAFSTPSPSQCATVPPTAPKKVKSKDFLSEVLDRARLLETVEHGREDYEKVLHQKRMASILNEVKFLKKTDWMYPSAESILGFKDERPITLTSQYESAANLSDTQMFRAARSTERNN